MVYDPSQSLAIGPQPQLGSNQSSGGLLGPAITTGALFGSGFIPTGQNKRLWDTYINAIRTVETASPFSVLKTFKISEFLSPLESYGKISVAPFEAKSSLYGNFLGRQFGEGAKRGVTLTKEGSFFGRVVSSTGDTLGFGIGISGGTQKGTAIADYYARVAGMPLEDFASLNDSVLKEKWRELETKQSFGDWKRELDSVVREQRLIVGESIKRNINLFGKNIALSEANAIRVTKGKVLGNLLRAKAAATAGRLNVLLSKPFEIPVIGDVLSKLPGIRNLPVKQGTATQMLGGYVKKALIVGAAWKGLEYLDYQRSRGTAFGTAAITGVGAALGGLAFNKPGLAFTKKNALIGAGIGLFASIAPRFKYGLFHGTATIGTDINLLRARTSEFTGVTRSLKEQEEVTPKLLDFKTALGFAGAGGLSASILSYGRFLGRGTKKTFTSTEPAYEVFAKTRQELKGDVGERFWKTIVGKKLSSIPGGKKLSKIKSPFALGALGGLLAWQTLVSVTSLLQGEPATAIPGVALLGSSKTEEELQRVYSGEEEVPVRKGRWWEAGRSSWEGKGIDYYRPHMIQRLKTRAYQKGIYGSEEEKWKYDPLLHPINAIFGSDDWKYHYEKKYQYERPAPITATYGQEIPFIGPIIASTIGKLLKPQKLIRPKEWMTPGGPIREPVTNPEEEAVAGLGGLGPGAPVNPTTDITNTANRLNYLRREAIGLPGFIENSITKAMIGREEAFPMETELETMGKETGSEYWLWKHLNLGGLAGSTEALRRFIPRTPSNWEFYNPLRNTQPSWMPENYFIDLKHGNIFNKIPEAEIRIPGPGYVSLHPELKGVPAEQYPLAHRVKILGDIAMWSAEYRSALALAKKSFDTMSPEEIEMVKTTERQVKERKKRREFSEYKAFSNNLRSETVKVTNVIDPRHVLTAEYGNVVLELQGFGAIKNMEKAKEFAEDNLLGRNIKVTMPKDDALKFKMGASGARMKGVAFVSGGKEYGEAISDAGLAKRKKLDDEFAASRWSLGQKLAGGLSEFALHNIETPLDYLTPLAPVQKLIHERSAIEEYIATQAVGTESSFWDRPIENFIEPTINMLRYKASPGVAIPESVDRKRAIQQYFDMLQWKKAKMLEKAARQVGDQKAADQYAYEKNTTLFGANVFGNPTDVMRALPRNDRDFFNAFVNAKTEEDKDKILSMIPLNQRRVYMSAWQQQAAQAAQAKIEAGIADEKDKEIINTYRKARKSQGFDYSEDDLKRYYRETDGEVPFDDYMREQVAEQYFKRNALPDPSWLGWNSAVQLDDVKMIYAESASIDFHDLDLWDARKRALVKKPYINSNLLSELSAASEVSQSSDFIYNARQLPSRYNSEHKITTYTIEEPVGRDRFNIEIEDKRTELVKNAFKSILGS